MDEISEQDLGEALRSAGDRGERGERSSIVSVATALRARISGPADPLRDIVGALERYPVEGCEHVKPEAEARPKTCACGPSLVSDDPGVLPLWARALACAPRPLIGARFADLLWSARYRDTPLEWARSAVDAYVAAAHDEFGHVVEIAEGLQRALAIASEIDDQPRRTAVIAELVGLANRSFASETSSSGVALAVIAALADLPPADRPEELFGLLERALDRYRDDAWLLEPALDIKARLVDSAEREQLRVAQIDAFARLAHRDAGVLRHAHYEHAIDLAERHGLPVIAEQLRAELADPSAPPAELHARGQAAETDARADGPVDEFMDHIVGNDSVGDALARFGAALPTEGFRGALDPAEIQRMSFFGVLAVDLLARIRARYGAVSAAGEWFECPLVEPAIATLIAHGTELYESGDWNGAASVLALQLDRIVRSVASASGAAEIGSDLGVSDVLALLAGTLYEPSRRYLRALLTEPARDPTAPDAALLLHAACHLRLLQPVEVTRAS